MTKTEGKYIMKYLIAAILTLSSFASSSAYAASYSGYVRNWWVQENGDITFYFLNQDNSEYVNGLCGYPIYVLQAGKANYDEAYSSLLLAAKNGYRVLMEVTTCSDSINIIKMPKICTWTGDC